MAEPLWSPGTPFESPQAADVFALMHDWLSAQIATGAVVPELPPRDGSLNALLMKLVADLGRFPAELKVETLQAIETFIGQGDVDDGLRLRVLRVLRAIDDVAYHHVPSNASFGDGLGAVLVATGRYNRDASGYVLPRHPLDGAGTAQPALSKCFFHLVRADVDRTQAPLVRCKGRSIDTPSVVVAPILYSHAWPGNEQTCDAAFAPDDLPDGRFCYRLDHVSPRLSDRIPRLLKEVFASNADLVLLPELSLDRSSFDVLCEQLRMFDQHQQRSVPRAFFLIVGVADGCRNRALVIDNAGNLLGETAKHLPWDLSINSQKYYDLLSSLGPPQVVRQECLCDNHGPRPIYASAANRWTVSICQDFDRASPLSPTARELAELRCGLVVNLVLDGLLKPGRWCVNSAVELAETTGATVVIANSLMLANTPTQRIRQGRILRLQNTYPHGRRTVGVVVDHNGAACWLTADMAGIPSLLSDAATVPVSIADLAP